MTDTGKAGNPTAGETTMIDWLSTVPVPYGASVATECYGTQLTTQDWDGTEYCDAALAGKSYTNNDVAKNLRRNLTKRA